MSEEMKPSLSPFYRLEGRTPVQCESDEEVIKEYGNKTGPVRVGWDKIRDVEISTVFLRTDHAMLSRNPVLFETMIFGGEHDQYLERYETLEEAQLGHIRACDMVKNRAGIGNEKVKP